jgi:hypothetical protein
MKFTKKFLYQFPFIIIIAIFLSLFISSQSWSDGSPNDKIIGKWIQIDGNSQIIARKFGSFLPDITIKPYSSIFSPKFLLSNIKSETGKYTFIGNNKFKVVTVPQFLLTSTGGSYGVDFKIESTIIVTGDKLTRIMQDGVVYNYKRIQKEK